MSYFNCAYQGNPTGSLPAIIENTLSQRLADNVSVLYDKFFIREQSSMLIFNANYRSVIPTTDSPAAFSVLRHSFLHIPEIPALSCTSASGSSRTLRSRSSTEISGQQTETAATYSNPPKHSPALSTIMTQSRLLSTRSHQAQTTTCQLSTTNRTNNIPRPIRTAYFPTDPLKRLSTSLRRTLTLYTSLRSRCSSTT